MNTPLLQLYKATFGHEPAVCTPISGSGSNRRYFRLRDNGAHSVVGVIGTNPKENHAFLYLTDKFNQAGLPVPKVLAVSDDEMVYLQEDLGAENLFDRLRNGRTHGYDKADEALLEATIRRLPYFQVVGGVNLDKAQLIPPTGFDRRSILFDLNYFKYCFLRTTDVAYDENLLQDDLEHFAADLEAIATSTEHTFFLYRDFQARNVMLRNGTEPYFIDYQSGRIGPLQYDVASFLLQVSAKYPAALKQKLLAAYLDELRKLAPQEAETFEASFKRFSLFRLLQVLGAYGLRGRYERKTHFLKSIPLAIAAIADYLDSDELMPYPHLRNTLRSLTNLREFEIIAKHNNTTPQPAAISESVLEVEVWSFSYKKGIPTDSSGNGGGYVFDCRSTHNPGRYEEYKQQTGLDLPVINFLEEDGEIADFLSHIYPLADHHVERYIKRGFTHLMFCFGCTGGQHRSVYCAQHLAEHISQRYKVKVLLTHREQGIHQIYQNGQLLCETRD